MNEEDAVKIFDLVVRKGMLPAKLDELVPLSFIGAAAVKFYQAKVKLMDQLGVTENQRKVTLADGQDAGEILLDIEARIGELLDHLPRDQGRKPDAIKRGELQKAGYEGQKAWKAADAARTIKANPAAVKAIIVEARENEDIPTKTAVLNKIRFDKEKARREEAGKQEKPEIILSLEEQGYLMKLEKTIYECPKESEIPRNWHEDGFKRACSMARIIYKRLEVLLNETKNLTDSSA